MLEWMTWWFLNENSGITHIHAHNTGDVSNERPQKLEKLNSLALVHENHGALQDRSLLAASLYGMTEKQKRFGGSKTSIPMWNGVLVCWIKVHTKRASDQLLLTHLVNIPAPGRLRSRSLHDTKKKNEGMLVCIVWGVMALISRYEKPNSAILEFWVPWGFWEIAGIVRYVLNPWASFNWPRSEPYGQRNVSETFDGMCTIFRVHRIRPWNHGLQVQLQERESQPSKPIHSISMQLAMPKHVCM